MMGDGEEYSNMAACNYLINNVMDWCSGAFSNMSEIARILF